MLSVKVLIVNLIECRANWKMGLWASLWGMILITVIDVAGPTHCRWHYYLAEILAYICSEREMNRVYVFFAFF